VNSYLDAPTLPFDKVDPISFWNDQPDSELKEIALKYLIIVATSVPSECAASAAGNTITVRRSTMDAAHASQLVFIKKNSYLLDISK